MTTKILHFLHLFLPLVFSAIFYLDEYSYIPIFSACHFSWLGTHLEPPCLPFLCFLDCFVFFLCHLMTGKISSLYISLYICLMYIYIIFISILPISISTYIYHLCFFLEYSESELSGTLLINSYMKFFVLISACC